MKKKLLAVAVSALLALQSFVPAYAAGIPNEEEVIVTEQAGESTVNGPAEDPEMETPAAQKADAPETPDSPEAGGSETPDSPEAGGSETPDSPEAGGSETPDGQEADGTEPGTPAETQTVPEESVDLESGTDEIIEEPDGSGVWTEESEMETGEPESDTEPSSEETFWDEELMIDLTDTSQTITVSGAAPKETHVHEVSVDCASGEQSVDFQPLTNKTLLQNGGSFYLTKDWSGTTGNTGGQISIPEGVTVNLCLNGYNIKPSSSQMGWRIIVNGTLNLCDCQGTGCISNGKGSTSMRSGGGIRNNGMLHMYGGTVTGNGSSTTLSAGIYSAGDTYIHGGSVTGNTTKDTGAGVYVSGGTFTMYDGTISYNEAANSSSTNFADGAGVYVRDADFIMEGGTIAYNESAKQAGGVSVSATGTGGKYEPTSFQMNGGYIEYNTAEQTAGGVYVGPGAVMTLNGGTIRGNSTTDQKDWGYGGAVYLMGGVSGSASANAVLKMQSGIIEQNSCAYGTVHLQNYAEFHMYGGEIRNNTAAWGGGAVSLWESVGSIELAGGSITGNSTDGYGGAVWAEDKPVTISGTTITGNEASLGGGIYLYSGALSLSGAPVITGNTAGGQADNLYLEAGQTIAIGGALTDGASVGVMTADKLQDETDRIVFTSAADADYSRYFSSDDPQLAVWNSDANELYLQTASEYALSYENMEQAGWQEGTDVPESYRFGYGLAELPVPVREGYRFDGWYATAGLLPEEQVTSVSREEQGAKTLWAKWTDVQPPVISVRLEDGKSSSQWYDTASVILSYEDNETANPEILVKIDDGAFQPAGAVTNGGAWTATEEGSHTYTFQAVDAAGNTVQSEPLKIMLDRTAPVFGMVSYEGRQNAQGGWIVGSNTTNAVITIIEAHSGVDEVSYVISSSDGTVQNGTAKVTDNRAVIPVPEDFTGTIRVNCKDAAGFEAEELLLRAQSEEAEVDTQLRVENTLSVKGKKLVITWGEIEGADGYEIYAASCGSDMKLVKTVSAKPGKSDRSVKIRKIGKKKIKKTGNYKAQVKAYRLVDGEKFYLATGLVLHAAGPSHSTSTNASKLTAAKKTYTVKKGERFRMSVQTIRQNTKKSLLSEAHASRMRYWTTNENVASVSATGYVKGKKKGTCYVYAAAQNGVSVRIKVKVK